jgi:hypothetical protein
MPTSPNTINLIRTKTSSSPQLDAIEASLRRTGYIGVVLFLCASCVIAMVYFLFYFEESSLQKEKADLTRRVNAAKNKEGLLLAIRDRTKTVEKAMANQKPWVKVLDLVETFAVPPNLGTITVDEQNKVVITLKAASLDEVLKMVNTIIASAKDNHLKDPQLISFQFGKGGIAELSVSFSAVF